MRDKRSERGILVGVRLEDRTHEEVEEFLEELERLADTAGVITVGRVIQSRSRPDPAYFIGRGKVEEIAQMVEELEADMVIFDDELSPAQTRNLEEALRVKVIDRTILILDIFAQRARTKEAKLEVELAQLQYMMPRLVRQWSHLSRIVGAGPGRGIGGVGARGPGETQLQLDRRLIRLRISQLKRELMEVERRRHIQRVGRGDIFSAALVGYTNAGKSTLLNKLADEHLFTEDKLFATLDPTTRLVRLPGKRRMLITDTVGFIRKLPHQLIASFKATLEEVTEADLLIHVVDASHPQARKQIDAVMEVLGELGAEDKPMLMVFNKIDMIEDRSQLDLLRIEFPEGVEISALKGRGLEELKGRLADEMARSEITLNLKLSYADGKIINYVHEHGTVLKSEYSENHVFLRARMARSEAMKLRRFARR
ncbi:TPA: GTPase HflX [Candidatus Poribacteria bacterium]|nr:GTPase HflX [Candidatus Poribacteria bacterium]